MEDKGRIKVWEEERHKKNGSVSMAVFVNNIKTLYFTYPMLIIILSVAKKIGLF